jgi:murein DD-endopeptidase MepM/ murein hydrolase activator NlpD
VNSVRVFVNSVRDFTDSVSVFVNSVRVFADSVQGFADSVSVFVNSVQDFTDSVSVFVNSVRDFTDSVRVFEDSGRLGPCLRPRGQFTQDTRGGGRKRAQRCVMGKGIKEPLGLGEMFGVLPVAERLREAMFMLKGDPYTPGSKFDRTSLNIFKPKLSLQMWFGIEREDGLIPLYNLFNHTQTPASQGWSVRYTQVEDFRGQGNTYDSHNGTDFAIPPGTVTVAPAPGKIMRISREFQRGGLKIFVDHGEGLVTQGAHLGRALVEVGDIVDRAQPIALTGASGVDMVGAFPWNCPHVHFNTWLNGEPIDPFARKGEVSIWRQHNEPVPFDGGIVPREDDSFTPTEWDMPSVSEAIAACRDPELRAKLAHIQDPYTRGADTLFYMNYFPTRFERRINLYGTRYARRPALDLPFEASRYKGVIHLF